MKLLASDFDNTLWFEDHMKEQDVEAIHAFQKEGHLFGVCTGRSLNGILRPSKQYGITYDFYILLSGGLILNKDYKPLLESQIPISLVKDIYQFTNNQNITLNYNDITYYLNSRFDDYVYDHEIHSFDEFSYPYVQSFSFHYQEDQIILAKEMTEKIKETFGQEIEAYQNNRHIDLAMKGCSKGRGMQIIQDYFGLSDDDIYGIGDNYNDLSMLEAIKHSYTFDYAPVDVQKHAKKVVSQLSQCIFDIKK